MKLENQLYGSEVGEYRGDVTLASSEDGGVDATDHPSHGCFFLVLREEQTSSMKHRAALPVEIGVGYVSLWVCPASL